MVLRLVGPNCGEDPPSDGAGGVSPNPSPLAAGGVASDADDEVSLLSLESLAERAAIHQG